MSQERVEGGSCHRVTTGFNSQVLFLYCKVGPWTFDWHVNVFAQDTAVYSA